MDIEPTIQAEFITGTKGRLFALHRPPDNICDTSECFVVAPAFAEEMNRCRYMCTILAQEIVKLGHGFLSVDPYGTGDSSGEFSEGDWSGWCDDVVTACNYAIKLGYRHISLLGIRMGALIAMDVAEHVESLRRIILWQPVISGKTALTQFLRIKIAASIERDEDAATVAGLGNDIDEGKTVQVAGYDISPQLFKGIQSSHLEKHIEYTGTPVAWFTTLASADRSTPKFELDFIEKWRKSGVQINHTTVIGPSYWAVHERTLAPSLIDATVAYLTEQRA